MRPPPRAALTFILLTVFIDSMGFGVTIPVLPKYIDSLVGGGASNAAAWGGWLGAVFAILQFFTAPIIGNLSDRFGRRPLLLGSLLAFSVDFFIQGQAPTIGWLFLGRALAGVFAATFSTAAAYIGDISGDEHRARNFGMIGAAWGMGFIVGPVIGGIASSFGIRAPFYVAAAMALGNACFGFFALPESLPEERRRPFQWARANAFGALRSLSHFPTIVGLLIGTFFYRLAHDSLPSVWTYFVVERFGFSERQIAWSLAFVGLMSALVMAVLTARIVPRLGERASIVTGFGLALLGFLTLAFAPSVGLLYVGLAVMALGGIANPTLQSLMSRQVGPRAQGELQGAVASLQSITMIVSPLVMTQLFKHFTAPGAPLHFAGISYLTAAGLTGICMLLCWRTLSRPEPGRDSEPAQTPEGLSPP